VIDDFRLPIELVPQLETRLGRFSIAPANSICDSLFESPGSNVPYHVDKLKRIEHLPALAVYVAESTAN
jgi:hypothetical protein